MSSSSASGGLPPSASSSVVGAIAAGERRHVPDEVDAAVRVPWAIDRPKTQVELQRAVREYVRRDADVEVFSS